MLRTLFSIVLALVPERYRSRFAWAHVSTGGAVASGTVQLLACLIALIYRYIVFANDRIFGGSARVMMAAAERGGETAIMGSGLFVLAEYAIQPLTLLLCYFAIEGLARLSAGLVTGEVVPTLPLQLLAWSHGKAAKVKAEKELGPPIEDVVQPGHGEFALVIASCRPKPWTNMTTIAFEEKMYELVREEHGQPPRPWIYVLRKRHEGKVIRGAVYDYRADELTRPAAPAPAIATIED